MVLGIEITLLVLTLIISGLLSAAEKAISTVNRNNMRSIANEGDKRGKIVVSIFEKSNKFFSASLIVTLFVGFLVIAMLTNTLCPKIGAMLIEKNINYGEEISVLLLTIFISGLYLVFGFLYPRQIAIQDPEKVALRLAGYAHFFTLICTPVVAIAIGITNIILRITGHEPSMTNEGFSEEEVMSMLEVGQEAGALKEEGKKMIDSIFAFDDKLAYEVMTPRTDVFTIDIEDETEEYIDELMEMRYSRIPVYEEDSDNIIGILNIKDYLIKAREKGFDGVGLKEILRQPFFVPDTKNIDSLFFELQKQKQHIAILIDEYGGFSGIVTMEDLIEEVMGNIDDEYDEEEPALEKIDNYIFLIDGNMDLDDINEQISTDFKSDNSETIGGFLIEILGEIPSENQVEKRQILLENYRFTIEEVLDRRIVKVKLEILPDIEKVSGEEEKTEENKEKIEETVSVEKEAYR